MKRHWNIGLIGLAIVCTIYGGSKPVYSSRFYFDEYLADAGSYATDDTVHVAAVKQNALIPDTTPVILCAAEAGTSSWFEVGPRRTYAALPADWTLADATNYNYLVTLDWAPPTPVVTNDVLLIEAKAAKDAPAPGQTLRAVLPGVAVERKE